MSTFQPHPACPLDLACLVDSGIAETLSTLEVGALYRLVRFAWRQDPPCSLPGEDTSLAMVARVTDEEWARLKPRLFLALAVTPAALHHAGGSTERLSLGHTRRVFEELAAKAAAISRQRSIAGRGNAKSERAVNEPLTGRQRAVDEPSSARSAAPSLRSSSVFAPSLQGSPPQSANPSAQSERSSGEEDVIAVLGEGARAILVEKLASWRREKSTKMLQDAIAKWRAAGLTTCPVQKASEMAEGVYAEPARVEWLITDADAKIAAMNKGERHCNPVAVLIAGLGQSEKTRNRPADIPLFVAERWCKEEADSLQLMRAQAALNAKLNRARTVLNMAESVQASQRHPAGQGAGA